MDKVKNSLQITVPKSGFVDEGDGVISFPSGLVITDGSVQRNGTRYDIDTLDVSKYSGQLTGDHEDKLSSLIGETIGVVKKNGKVIVNKIRYAINENPYGRLAYDLLRGGFSKNFSTETIGPQPDEYTGVYHNAELVGLSQVVTQNNYNAHVNKFTETVHNSLEQSKQAGLNVNGIEERVLNSTSKEERKMEEDKNKKVEETKLPVEEVKDEESTKVQSPAVEDAEDDKKIVETTDVSETDNNEVDVEEVEETESTKVEAPEVKEAEDENKNEEVENEVEEEEVEKEEDKTSAKNDTESEKETEEVDENEKETNKKEQTMTKEEIAEVVKNALTPIATELASVREEAKNAFDASAKEPEFKKSDEVEVAKNDYKSMDFQDRYQAQVDAAWNYLQNGNIAAGETLRAINAANLEALKEAKIARNSISLEELGNFVIAPEMYNEIAGHRNDYSAILNATEWKETLSLEFAWLERVGDIDMRPVALNATEDDEDANLKPISEYSAVPRKSELEELAAVTVVANSATRFAAVDLLSDAAQGYRNDYDRKRAQLVIAKLEQAVDGTGYSVGYDTTGSEANLDALTTWIEAVTQISDTTLNGTLIFNARTFAELKSRALRAGANGPLSEILTTGELPTVFGYRFVIVPNDLMPSLGGSEVVTHTVEGVNVRINHAVFFADLSTFTGRTSGGLQYDVSNSAPYEVNGVTRSAYQRNELVLRGSFFRGGAVKDREVVSGILQGAAPVAS